MLKKLLVLICFLFSSFFTGHVFAVEGTGDLASPDFIIETSIFSPGGTEIKSSSDGTSKGIVNTVLLTTIQKLMIALGILSLLIMTVGAGFIILYHGQDELLSKGKSIFNSGIIALAVALSSYFLVSLVRYILYN